MNSRLAEASDGIEVVKGTAQEPQEIERFTGDPRRFRQALVRQGQVEARFLPLLLLGGAAARALPLSPAPTERSALSSARAPPRPGRSQPPAPPGRLTAPRNPPTSTTP